MKPLKFVCTQCIHLARSQFFSVPDETMRPEVHAANKLVAGSLLFREIKDTSLGVVEFG